MKKSMLMIAIAATTLPGLSLAAGDDARIQSSRAAVKEFSGKLKGELQAAMKEGGPTKAIPVCHTRAPEIAGEVSAAHNLTIARTSMKNRNPNQAPDAWETAVLKDFQERMAAGEDPKTMEFSEVVESDGQQNFRYMKAIPTGEVCLKCHGQNIAPEVKAKLEELYPEDKATGYSLGQLRGAFTIKQPM